MSLKALREIFRQYSPSELPADFAACLAGDTQAITANHAAYKRWGSNREQDRRTEAHRATDHDATQNPSQAALMALTVPQLDLSLTEPMEHTPSQESLAADGQATVHRTGPHMTRGKRTQGDISLQVCSDKCFMRVEQNEIPWEPHFLFPELRTFTSTATGKQGPTYNKHQLPPRVPRNRITKKTTNGEKGLVNIDANAFIDVPLQQAEGRDFLALIGAGSIPIPSHVILSAQQPVPIKEVGQSSKAQTKRRKNAISAQEVTPHPGQGLGPDNVQANQERQGCQENTDRESEMAQSLVQCQQGPLNDGARSQIDDHLDDQEDPYLDQVDYSDGDVDLSEY